MVVIANYCSGCGGQRGICLASLDPEELENASSPSSEGDIVLRKPRYERLQ